MILLPKKLTYVTPALLVSSLFMFACSSNTVKNHEFHRLNKVVVSNSKTIANNSNSLINQRKLDSNTMIILLRMTNHIEYLEKKLCGVKFVVNSRTLQVVPENGYPIKDNCTTKPIFTQEELDIINSYIHN